jgi:hypothetical protein
VAQVVPAEVLDTSAVARKPYSLYVSGMAPPAHAKKNKLRVVQSTTGIVGKTSLRAIVSDPRLEFVGV